MGARSVRRGRPVVARLCLDAFPGAWRWQDCALMRSRAAIRGKFFTPCIPKGASDEKRGASWQDLRAMHPKTGWLWQDMRAMYPKSPANRRWRIHRVKILPGRDLFRCTDPSNHARRADLAIRRRRTTLAPATPVPPEPRSAKAQLGGQPRRKRSRAPHQRQHSAL